VSSCHLKIGTKIVLNEAEQRLAKFLAKSRYMKNRQSNTKDGKVGPQDCETTDLEGIAAEIAFCKMVNVYPDLQLDERPEHDATLPCGTTVDVKATKYKNGKLLAVPGKVDKSDGLDTYSLVVGEFPGPYEFKGFCKREELLRQERLTNLGYGPTYAAEQKELSEQP
jgi:hypothetical protein